MQQRNVKHKLKLITPKKPDLRQFHMYLDAKRIPVKKLANEA